MQKDKKSFQPQTEMSAEQANSVFSKKKGLKYFLLLFIIIPILFILILTQSFQVLNNPPDSFPLNEVITIEPGTDVREITNILQEHGVVRSKALLYYTIVFFNDPTKVKASKYVFREPLSTTEVARRLTEGDFDTDLLSFTHYEGERVNKIATRADELLSDFDTQRFIALAEPKEGRLFPDTYFIPPTFTEEDLLDLMLKTFDDNIATLKDQIDQHELSIEEIIILASIIEREANSPESKKIVSGILQNRLETGMPLQADASIEYVLDKPLAELTSEDLKLETPYNTYLNKGLPPTPIGNPGLDAINAVLEPTDSDYYYYITDDNGVFHYAETYYVHQRNIEIYLK